jgi:UTP--glucose-1-phosphate uridylyltransferase
MENISLYGCVAVETDQHDGSLKVADLVEKPTIAEAPSNYAIIGRYILDPAVYSVLEKTKAGRGGEIQLTDALRVLATMPASEGGGVRGVVFSGRRYDTGDKLSYLQAVIQLAAEREDIGPELTIWLQEFCNAQREGS